MPELPLVSVDLPILGDRGTGLEERVEPRQLVLIVGAVLVFLVAGASSWLIVKPGYTLLWPMTVDAILFASFAVLCRLVSALRGTRFGRRGPSLFIIGLGVASLLWTYFGVLPASVGFDSAAANVARSEVARAAQGCQLVRHGSIGFLAAPYKICTTVIPGSSNVLFATPNLYRGYAYVSGRAGESWFPDQCSRHLTGHWWAFFDDAQSTVFGCPFGYTNHGGG